MRIFLAGGSGTIGSRLIPPLVQAGHSVVATTRWPANLEYLRRLGATGVAVDVYDAPHLATVLRAARPDLVVHQLTDFGDFDSEANARLLRAGTANLVAAAESAGVERIIAQSDASAYAPGLGPAVEDDPIRDGSAVAAMESLVTRASYATVLRYGILYGPRTWYEPGGRTANAVASGLIPATSSVASFVHIDDVVRATVQSIDWPVGAYNIVDDEPSSGLTWLPIYADRLGAPMPAAVTLPIETKAGRGASNVKARLAGWHPEYPSWRDGFPRA